MAIGHCISYIIYVHHPMSHKLWHKTPWKAELTVGTINNAVTVLQPRCPNKNDPVFGTIF